MYETGTAPGNNLPDPFCPDETEFGNCFSLAIGVEPTLDSNLASADWACYTYPPASLPVPSIPAPNHIEFVGTGHCTAGALFNFHDFTKLRPAPFTLELCDLHCQDFPDRLLGFSYDAERCLCYYEDGYAPGGVNSEVEDCPVGLDCQHHWTGTGEIESSTEFNVFSCWKYKPLPSSEPRSEVNGDPHFRTWKNEHFEFHGQCDLVMTKVEDFANQPGVDLEIHLRTKMVRYWSYIKAVAVRIGNDILEVEGAAAMTQGGDHQKNYHINYEYRGTLDTLGGFPVTNCPRGHLYTIDLGSAYPGQKIEIKTFKEFIAVRVIGATEESFGNSIGIMGDFKTGKTLARDGITDLHDFNELGLEWQVLPSDGKMFHEASRPQFPERCYLPEDPRGDRTRRLGESEISEEAAEAACAKLQDEFDRKGCVYDILATQDMDMVGAY